ncbi:TPA: 3-deoxy-8-phosphooctulonate synthase [Candidatus Dependentiae bacterium]|nr:MAG: 2-dehydro-3-deoxyphosphooctonate aldolase [candidate division TM6 bacterium GW2011_GWE2_31_21]KKP53938.1 MAG: 2-dehydro-3-deoxyphosphooctonate aldolase [candidate division TM6 bacterium GW2011_GWF2_33_332]HBS47718.1 3-deoxy-8-phosphooctulonate synthase [Candidatus Dependentiae bacterium]HBZ73867.1 3-deoxy-8-phosphooctulonate synthase [Candidatus Dependentiae bacterium]
MLVENKNFSFLKEIRGNEKPLIFILGPCVIESESHTLKMAESLKKLSEKLNFKLIFKSSFDKANRTSLSGFRGVGLATGKKILSKVKNELDLPIITDVHESSQVEEISSFADILQIPAFLCRQTDLLLAVGKSGKIVHLKKGQFVTCGAIEKAAKKIESTGNKNIWLCERGYAFGYGDLIVDFRNFTTMKSFGRPVTFDATHSVQKPSGLGDASGGDRSFVADLAISAVSAGIAGIFMEVHDNPEKALCDGPNSIRLSQLEDLIKYLMELDAFVKSKKRPEIY